MANCISNHILVFPLPMFRATLLGLTKQNNADLPLRLLVGRHRHSDACEWLVRKVISGTEAQGKNISIFELVSDKTPNRQGSSLVTGRLFYRHKVNAFQLWGIVREKNINLPITELRLIGAGMHRLPLVTPDD
jgi:hypothetical protein